MNDNNAQSIQAALALEPELLQLTQALSARIIAEIDASGGFLPYSRYMEWALYSPEWGYYHNGLQKIGPEGDFVTAPEISPLFGATLADWLTPVLQFGCNQILEFGAGSGRLAADIIRRLDADGNPLERYRILELSGTLRARQEALLRSALGEERMLRVEWLEQFPEGPLRGVVLANEVLDAMPVEVFCWRDNTVWQRGVTHKNGQLVWSERRASGFFAETVQQLQARCGPWPDGYVSEWRPSIPGWIQLLASQLERGLIFIADYGYPRQEFYAPERNMGTLLAYHRQRVVMDTLSAPGVIDLTASVDFTAVAEAATNQGLDVLAYAGQGEFLLGAGMPRIFENWVAGSADPRDTLQWAQQVRMLTLPGEMGERFQVMVLGRGCSLPPSTFPDRRERL